MNVTWDQTQDYQWCTLTTAYGKLLKFKSLFILKFLKFLFLFSSLLEFMTAPSESLKSRVYNVTAMSFTPQELACKIVDHIPDFQITYKPDSRQSIADSWPEVFDDSEARADWGWNPQYDLDKLVELMIRDVKEKYIDMQKVEVNIWTQY